MASARNRVASPGKSFGGEAAEQSKVTTLSNLFAKELILICPLCEAGSVWKAADWKRNQGARILRSDLLSPAEEIKWKEMLFGGNAGQPPGYIWAGGSRWKACQWHTHVLHILHSLCPHFSSLLRKIRWSSFSIFGSIQAGQICSIKSSGAYICSISAPIVSAPPPTQVGRRYTLLLAQISTGRRGGTGDTAIPSNTLCH